ncbi:hypothetical protein [Gordonia sp. (in: high G+C Gram-positive bacteria)]|uniref:hypothetical protein n=1 Tax=Gordonia sp. (in: high G+C Gram-positive bacteria) TaxID=84139 RepID=UPI001D81E469|nr:hypothetical protein [Gordonia sp. (in: high G+C Gram-positive bacteria)]MCB1295406.1 hypothetical protein [Gordonia sp. (in: high G+C Gram-positive bacteria)]HMS76569.1 hypothetical protein [Gordonia sp. (in: high G+C Gram-positive bacteria)]
MNNAVGAHRRTAVVAVLGALTLTCAVPGAAVADPLMDGLDTGSAGGIFSGSAQAAGSSGRDGSPNGVDGSLRQVNCNQQSKSAGEAVTNTRHMMGRTGPMSFTLNYNTGTQADRIEVFYHGKVRADTGPVTGTGSKHVTVPAGTNTYVTVKVTGPVGGSWNYTVQCPV